jgi:hypothetical protein
LPRPTACSASRLLAFAAVANFTTRRGGYVGTHPDLRQPVVALSLGGLRRKVEIAMLPDDPVILLSLDKLARKERDRRRADNARPRPGLAGTSA